MKCVTSTLLAIAAVVLMSCGDLIARGGGRGGGGGGGGGRVGGGGGGMSRPSAGRSPALGGGGARPSTGGGARPSTGARPGTGAGAARPGVGAGAAARPGVGPATRPTAGVRPVAGNRPTAGQLNDFLDVPRPSTGAIGAGAIAGGALAGGAAAEFLQQGGARPATRPAGGGERPGPGNRPGVENRQNRRQDFAQNQPARVGNREERQGNRNERRDQIRDQVAENHPRLDFWSDHPNWTAWRINAPYRWATWAALGAWCGWGSSEPAYCDYGDTVYYEDGGVYSGDKQVASQEEYTQQAEALVESAPATDPAKAEWMPVGVFAITQDGQKSGETPTLYAQLAINKQGVIAGTLNNQLTGETQTLEGMADKKTQRTAWSVKGKTWPITETSVANLTKDTSSALVHFADGETQQWLLVRLEDPKKTQ